MYLAAYDADRAYQQDIELQSTVGDAGYHWTDFMAGRKRPAGSSKAGRSKRRRTNGRAVSRRATQSVFPAEVKYFDTTFSAAVQQTADWAASNVAMTSYLASDGTLTAYTDSAIIPSANGSGYGQVIGNKYILRALRVRGQCSFAVMPD